MIFWSVLFLGIVLRCIYFGQIPAGINQDEAMGAVDAFALSKYATDRYGVFMPVHFTAWIYSQMSVFQSYCMIPFIKIFGFNTVAVRLPMLLASCGAIALIYLIAKKICNEKVAFIAMFLTVINPWQFMQSRWTIDCNMFPHVFLLAFYLLLLGLEKRRYLYISMIFFGFTFYCYGIAAYSVPAFLGVFFLWCIWKKQIKFREGVLCAIIFIIIALPEVMVLAINYFQRSTQKTPFFTLSYFPDSLRGNDILLVDFSWEKLSFNIMTLIRRVFLQKPDGIPYNSIPKFGTLYHISIPFVLLGIGIFTWHLFREKKIEIQTKMLALWGFLIMGIWVGIVTYYVNINRINIIFYPLILLCAYGIYCIIDKWKKVTPLIALAYGICGSLFFYTYFTDFAKESEQYYYNDFLKAVEKADHMEEYDRLYITGNMGWCFSQATAEILTQYVNKIDALYYQEKTNITGDRELLSYYERYHYIYPEQAGEEFAEYAAGGLLVVHQKDIPYLEAVGVPYEVLDTVGEYFLLEAGDEFED